MQKTQIVSFLYTPKDASFGLSQRKITGATAAAPAMAKVFGSVMPAIHKARAAAKNDRAQLAIKPLACSISLPLLF